MSQLESHSNMVQACLFEDNGSCIVCESRSCTDCKKLCDSQGEDTGIRPGTCGDDSVLIYWAR